MSGLADAAADYLALRRALGFKLRAETWWLPDFVSFLDAHGSKVITTDLALQWAQRPPDAAPSWWAKKLGAIRRFAKHHRAFDSRTEVPPTDLLPFRRQRLVPHIYTDDEILALVGQARCLPDPMRSATFTTMIGLLAVTGMRVSEAIGLDRHDVDWRRSLLVVRDSKFKKSRHVPLHPSTLAALHDYAARRDRLCPHARSPSFFISRVGTRVIHQPFQRCFVGLLHRVGITTRGDHRPRIHDLRHSFAVKTLTTWYRTGVDVEARLPSLSTYLGHVNPSTTYWYLTATPELLALAAKRLERASRVRP